jgi:hypothetical protein
MVQTGKKNVSFCFIEYKPSKKRFFFYLSTIYLPWLP